jgi:potassium-transporting ATPase potassium-binding subunit
MYPLLYILLTLTVVLVLAKPIGKFIARVFMGKYTVLEVPFGWLERLIYRACGIDPAQEMSWGCYARSVLWLGLAGFLLLYAIVSLQHLLPLNPNHYAGVSPDLAFNIAMSFVTNTNWQSYSGETTLSHFSQMVGLVFQNFFSAATSLAVAAALARAIARRNVQTIGNAYADIVRATLYILLPLSLIFSVLLLSQGVVQTMDAQVPYIALESGETQMMAQGPVASQVAIKMLGSNGGGFFNTNAAHPFENPTPISNFLQMISILLVPAALAYAFGVMVNDRRQGWMLLATMLIIFLPLLWLVVYSEQQPSPYFEPWVIDSSSGNMEGKERRFGAELSAFWAAATTTTSNGSVNAAHAAFTPLGALVPLVFMQFSEVVFGGVGSGLYNILMFVLLTVFMGGLMVGRTPEYLGKKLGPFEIKMASLVVIIPSMVVLFGTALAVLSEAGRAGLLNHGPRGFTEILYAFTSAGNNNGSAFAGLSSNSVFYNISLGISMFIGRYWVIVPVLAVAGSLAGKNITPLSAGTLPTHTPLFVSLLVGVVVILGVLTYVPSLALGPLAEHFLTIETIARGQ